MLIGGKKGHVATFDWQTGKLGCEFHVRETVCDVTWLHNKDYIAVAQKKVRTVKDIVLSAILTLELLVTRALRFNEARTTYKFHLLL